MSIRGEIREFRKENGNVTYTVKELLEGLHTKTRDNFKRVDNKLEELAKVISKHHQTIAENYVDKKTFRWVIGGMSAVILVVIGWVFMLK